MKRLTVRILFATTAFTVIAASAAAGEISGKITPSPADPSRPTVVWLEGIKDSRQVPAPARLSQKGIQFSPSLLVVVAGQTVEMPNDDNVVHNVYSKSAAKKFDLGVYDRSTTKSVVFDTPGLVEIRCALHRRMKGEVLVVPNGYYSSSADGSFRIRNVPAGNYRLIAWRSGSGQQSRDVVVPKTKPVRIDVEMSGSNATR